MFLKKNIKNITSIEDLSVWLKKIPRARDNIANSNQKINSITSQINLTPMKTDMRKKKDRAVRIFHSISDSKKRPNACSMSRKNVKDKKLSKKKISPKEKIQLKPSEALSGNKAGASEPNSSANFSNVKEKNSRKICLYKFETPPKNQQKNVFPKMPQIKKPGNEKRNTNLDDLFRDLVSNETSFFNCKNIRISNLFFNLGIMTSHQLAEGKENKLPGTLRRKGVSHSSSHVSSNSIGFDDGAKMSERRESSKQVTSNDNDNVDSSNQNTLISKKRSYNEFENEAALDSTVNLLFGSVDFSGKNGNDFQFSQAGKSSFNWVDPASVSPKKIDLNAKDFVNSKILNTNIVSFDNSAAFMDYEGSPSILKIGPRTNKKESIFSPTSFDSKNLFNENFGFDK